MTLQQHEIDSSAAQESEKMMPPMLRIPAELRLKIYDLAIVGDSEHSQSKRPTTDISTFLAIFYTHTTFRSELTQLYHLPCKGHETIVRSSAHIRSFSKRMPPRLTTYITHVTLDLTSKHPYDIKSEDLRALILLPRVNHVYISIDTTTYNSVLYVVALLVEPALLYPCTSPVIFEEIQLVDEVLRRERREIVSVAKYSVRGRARGDHNRRLALLEDKETKLTLANQQIARKVADRAAEARRTDPLGLTDSRGLMNWMGRERPWERRGGAPHAELGWNDAEFPYQPAFNMTAGYYQPYGP